MKIDKDIKYGLKLGLLFLQNDKDCCIISRNRETEIWDCFIYDLKEWEETVPHDKELDPRKEISLNTEKEVVEFVKNL